MVVLNEATQHALLEAKAAVASARVGLELAEAELACALLQMQRCCPHRFGAWSYQRRARRVTMLCFECGQLRFDSRYREVALQFNGGRGYQKMHRAALDRSYNNINN